MNEKLLKKILVDELEAGMFIHAIAEQNGALEVKSRGRITSTSGIPKLKNQGIVSVVIDTSKTQELEHTSSIVEAVKQVAPENKPKKLEDLDMELGRVDRLMLLCSKTHKRILIEAKKDELHDISAAKELVAEIQSSLERNPSALLCLSTIQNSNSYLSRHALRVSVLLCYFAQSMGIKKKDCEDLGLLGYLYDIGMTSLPNELLQKNTHFTEQERALVQQHPIKSAEILSGLGLSSSAMLAVEQHHERINGEGYPKQLSGEMINKYARILAIADAFDAMTTERSHKKAITPIRALKTLLDPKNGFDLKLANAFAKCIGLYPTGSLVLLSNQRIALVMQQNDKKPSVPKVKVFYSTTGNHYMEPKDINLDGNSNGLKIEKPVLASSYNIDIKQLFPNR